jgi:hypothetical protein
MVDGTVLSVLEGALLRLGTPAADGPAEGPWLVEGGALGKTEGTKEGVAESPCPSTNEGAWLGIVLGREDGTTDGPALVVGILEGTLLSAPEGGLLSLGALESVGSVDGAALDEGEALTAVGLWLGTTEGDKLGAPDGRPEGLGDGVLLGAPDRVGVPVIAEGAKERLGRPEGSRLGSPEGVSEGD